MSWHKGKKKWCASIGYQGKQIYLGAYDNLDDAIKARKKAENEYFKEYSYNNSQKGLTNG